MVSAAVYTGLKQPFQLRVQLDLKSDLTFKVSHRTGFAIRNICNYFNIQPWELKSKSRVKHLVTARIITCHWLRHNTHFSLKKIGQIIGNRDHSTVIYNLEIYKDLLKFDKDFQKIVRNIKIT